jgi:hypothetical protein
VESAFQWLETHAMMKDNVDWTALRDDTADIIANARTTADTLPAICLAIRGLGDGNAWVLVPGLETPNFFTGYSTLYPDNQVVTEVGPDSPAGKAGLQVGDRIEQVSGQAPVPYEDVDAYPPCNERKSIPAHRNISPSTAAVNPFRLSWRKQSKFKEWIHIILHRDSAWAPIQTASVISN